MQPGPHWSRQRLLGRHQGQGPEEPTSELRAMGLTGLGVRVTGQHPAGPPVPLLHLGFLDCQARDSPVAPRSPGSRPCIPSVPSAARVTPHVHESPELALERGGQAWGWGGCWASALKDAWGPWPWPSWPGMWGCFLFCERVVFSIQNNKRGSLGLAAWRGHCPPRPRSQSRWRPHVGSPPARLLVAGRDAVGLTEGRAPGRSLLTPQPPWAAQCPEAWMALPQPRAQTLQSPGLGCLGPVPGRAAGEQGRELARPPGVPSARARRRASALPVGHPETGAGGCLRACSQGPPQWADRCSGTCHARPRPRPRPAASGEGPRARPGSGQVGRGPGALG